MGNKRPTFGARLKELRKKAGYTTQDDFSEAFGRSLDTVQNWEQDKKYPPMKTFLELCDFLKCDADYLAGRIEQKTHDLTFLCAETGLSPEAIQALAEIKSGPFGGDDMHLVSIILSSAKFKDILRSIKDAKWAGDEVEELARSAFGLNKNDPPSERLRAYQELEGAIRMLRACRFEVSEAAASILNKYLGIDEMLLWIQKEQDHFDLKALERAADNELEKEIANEH